jgi:hypothetical protein
MTRIFDEEFVPIAAELQRLPYMSPSRDFADRVIARIDRLQPARELAPVVASRHLELHRGGQQAVAQRRPMGVVRATGTAVVGVALIAAPARQAASDTRSGNVLVRASAAAPRPSTITRSRWRERSSMERMMVR